MLSSDTRAMGCFVDVVWYDLNATPERVGGSHNFIGWFGYNIGWSAKTQNGGARRIGYNRVEMAKMFPERGLGLLEGGAVYTGCPIIRGTT